MIQVYAAKDRIPCMHLDDQRPSAERIRAIDSDAYIPTPEDHKALREELELQVAMIMVENIAALKQYKGCFTPKPHQYQEESKKKSELVKPNK